VHSSSKDGGSPAYYSLSIAKMNMLATYFGSSTRHSTLIKVDLEIPFWPNKGNHFKRETQDEDNRGYIKMITLKSKNMGLFFLK